MNLITPNLTQPMMIRLDHSTRIFCESLIKFLYPSCFEASQEGFWFVEHPSLGTFWPFRSQDTLKAHAPRKPVRWATPTHLCSACGLLTECQGPTSKRHRKRSRYRRGTLLTKLKLILKLLRFYYRS